MTKYLALTLTALILSSCNDSYEEILNGYHYRLEGRDDIIIRDHHFRTGDKYIPCKVVDYESDGENYIFVTQVARDKCFFEGSNPLDQREGKTYYWIIDTFEREYLGPFDSNVCSSHIVCLDLAETADSK